MKYNKGEKKSYFKYVILNLEHREDTKTTDTKERENNIDINTKREQGDYKEKEMKTQKDRFMLWKQ